MGNEASTLSSLSAEYVASAVAKKGKTYEQYADAIRENGVDGSFLASLLDGEEKLSDVFDGLEITLELHRMVLRNYFHQVIDSCRSKAQQQDTKSQQSKS